MRVDVLLFLFTRRDGTTRADFRKHYLSVHAPLSARHSVATERYVVRLAEGDDSQDDAGPGDGLPPLDAVTEIWTPSAEAFFDPKQSFDTPEAADEILTDAFTFLGPFPVYRMRRTELGFGTDGVRLPSGADAVPLAERSPGVTFARLALTGRPDLAPLRLPAGAVRTHTRYDVLEKYGSDGPDLRYAELAHLRDPAAVPAGAGPGYRLGEYIHSRESDPAY